MAEGQGSEKKMLIIVAAVVILLWGGMIAVWFVFNNKLRKQEAKYKELDATRR